MRHPAGDEQAPAFKFFFDYLARNELAPAKVPGSLARDLEQHFGLALAHPDAVLLHQRGVDGRVGRKRVTTDLQAFHLAERVGLEPGAVARRQVPDAAVVDQLVRLHACIGLDAFAFLLTKANAPVLQDGFLQAPKVALPLVQVFVVVAPDEKGRLQAAVQDVTQEVVRERRKKTLHSGQGCKAPEVPQAELAQVGGVQEILLACLLQRQESKAFLEVTLDGAHVHRELCSQRLRLEPFALVELAQDPGQPAGKLVVVSGVMGH